MFELSSKTQVNKRFKMSELFKMIDSSKEVRADAKNVVSVTLTKVMSCETMNFVNTGEVKEIYIFSIELVEKFIPSLFIAALDKAINLHTIFILTHGEEEMLYGAYKQATEKGVKVGKYYGTSWSANYKPVEIPLTISSLDEVYTIFIDELIPVAARQNESALDLVERFETICKLQKEIEKLQRQVDTERQSKKRFELNEELKQKKKELEKYE